MAACSDSSQKEGKLYTQCSFSLAPGHISVSPILIDKLKKLWGKCGKVYVTRQVFNKCFQTIEDWINIGSLTAHMMTHDLITKPKQISNITNPYHSSDEQMRSLLSHIDTCGKHAYFVLYVCLYESQEENLGHRDAVEELQKAG